MTEKTRPPDLGALVRPLIQALPSRVQPRLMAELERAAADRYQASQSDEQRYCAELEERSAECLEALLAKNP